MRRIDSLTFSCSQTASRHLCETKRGARYHYRRVLRGRPAPSPNSSTSSLLKSPSRGADLLIQWQRCAGRSLCAAARSRQPGAAAAAPPARLDDPFTARARGRMHRLPPVRAALEILRTEDVALPGASGKLFSGARSVLTGLLTCKIGGFDPKGLFASSNEGSLTWIQRNAGF